MTKLSRDDVLHLAQLARISLSDSEIDEFSVELSAILQYVDQLSSVDVDALKPTNQVTGLTNVMRDDVVQQYSYKPDSLLQNVPMINGDLIQVKRMIG